MSTRDRERYAAAKLRHWGAPVPDHLRHYPASWASKAYGCDCEKCLPSGRRRRLREDRPLTATERDRRSRQNLRGRPVPPHVKHGSYAYNVYACRCETCLEWKGGDNWLRRNRWTLKAHGRYRRLPDRVIIHWPPRDAPANWCCPECGEAAA